MKEYLKAKIVTALKVAMQSAVTAFLTALGLGALGGATGCTTVVVTNDEAKAVSVTGAIPLALQFNNTDTKNN